MIWLIVNFIKRQKIAWTHLREKQPMAWGWKWATQDRNNLYQFFCQGRDMVWLYFSWQHLRSNCALQDILKMMQIHPSHVLVLCLGWSWAPALTLCGVWAPASALIQHVSSVWWCERFGPPDMWHKEPRAPELSLVKRWPPLPTQQRARSCRSPPSQGWGPADLSQ